VRLDPITLRSPDALGTDAPGLDEVKDWLKAGLLAEPEFAEKGQKAHARVNATYRANHEEAKDGSGQILGAVFLDVTIQIIDAKGRRTDAPRTEAFIGEALPDGVAPGTSLRDLVARVTGEVAADLARQIRPKYAEDDALVGFLGRKDDSLLRHTIPEARKRRLKATETPLIAILKHKERELVNLAASALGDVGSEKAVPALIDAGSRVQPIDRLPVLYALGQIGGPQAEVYLETLISGTEHPPLKRAAEQALEQVKRKKKTP
jgi:hypothetical protein